MAAVKMTVIVTTPWPIQGFVVSQAPQFSWRLLLALWLQTVMAVLAR